MNLEAVYPFAVFVHVVGAVGLGAAVGVEALALGRLRRAATTDDARGWLRQLALGGRIGPYSMLAVLASGIWMTATVWGHVPWVATAFAGMVVMGALGGGVTGRALRRLGAALQAERGVEPSEDLRARLATPVLTASLWLRAGLLVGVLGLMTVKPSGTATSALILTGAAALGLAASAGSLAGRRKGAQAGET